MTYGPKSDGVPEGSLGGGGRLIKVGPDARDMAESVESNDRYTPKLAETCRLNVGISTKKTVCRKKVVYAKVIFARLWHAVGNGAERQGLIEEYHQL